MELENSLCIEVGQLPLYIVVEGINQGRIEPPTSTMPPALGRQGMQKENSGQIPLVHLLKDYVAVIIYLAVEHLSRRAPEVSRRAPEANKPRGLS